MHIVRAVFEQGIELRLTGDRWTISSTPSDEAVTFATLGDALTRLHPLRPLLVTEKRSYGPDLSVLLCCDGVQYFGVRVSDLMNRSLTAETIYPVYHLGYLLGAVSYHCQQLAELYAQISARYYEIAKIPNYSGYGDVGMFGDQTKPYYEFEALVGAARRAYASMRYPLWQRFGPKGSTPRSLEGLLKAQSTIPEVLHAQLAASWEQFGIPLTHYRDCIHHYVPIESGMASAYMRRHNVGGWTTLIRIPDNPESRSKKSFSFTLGLDALTYGRELADEVLRIASAVVDAAVPPRENV